MEKKKDDNKHPLHKEKMKITGDFDLPPPNDSTTKAYGRKISHKKGGAWGRQRGGRAGGEKNACVAKKILKLILKATFDNK